MRVGKLEKGLWHAKCQEQELRKKRKVGAEGFEPSSAGFHYGGSYPPRNQ